MSSRLYPSNAVRGGATTLTGSGSANDIFTFPFPVKAILQNDTGATVYVAAGAGPSAAATQGDEAVAATQEWGSDDMVSWVAIYGAASTAVNGTTSGGLVLYGDA